MSFPHDDRKTVRLNEAERVFAEKILPEAYADLSPRDRYIAEQLTQLVSELYPLAKCIQVNVGADRSSPMRPSTRTEIRFLRAEALDGAQMSRALIRALNENGIKVSSKAADVSKAYHRDVGSVAMHELHRITLEGTPHQLFSQLAAFETAKRVGYPQYAAMETVGARGI